MKYTKKYLATYNKDFHLVCSEYECDKKDNKYSFNTKFGTLIVTLRPEDPDFIPMIFDHDFNLEGFLKQTYDYSINRHSYKWNIHVLPNEEMFSLDILQVRLDGMMPPASITKRNWSLNPT